jgi:DNA-binding transcriptional ArsR family regulator
VYVYALKHGKVGVREVQRGLGLSNPSLAQYHLNKLNEMGLVKVDAMRGLFRIGTLIVPRFVFYAVLFTVFATYLGYASYQYFSQFPLLAWFEILLVLACVVYWFEAANAWFSAPSF